MRSVAGKFEVGRKDARFWPVVGVVLDVLEATQARVSEAAAALGISTGGLIDFLDCDPRWQALEGTSKWRAYQRKSAGPLAEEWTAQKWLTA